MIDIFTHLNQQHQAALAPAFQERVPLQCPSCNFTHDLRDEVQLHINTHHGQTTTIFDEPVEREPHINTALTTSRTS